MNARQYLKYLRAKCGIDEGLFESQDFKVLVDHLNQISKEMGLKNYSRQNLRNLILNRLQVIYDKMVTMCDKLSISLANPATVGHLPIGDLNACATQAPNRDNIIILDMFLSKVLLDTCSALFGFAILRHNDEVTNENLLPYLMLILNAYAELSGDDNFQIDSSSIPDLINLPPQQISHAATMAEAISLFILAHEYSHHHLGHLKETKIINIGLKNKNTQVSFFIRSHQQEFEADQLAMDIFLKCSMESSDFLLFRNLSILKYIPLLFFDILAAFELIRKGNITSSISHPSPLLRKEKLINVIKEPNIINDSVYTFYQDLLKAFALGQ